MNTVWLFFWCSVFLCVFSLVKEKWICFEVVCVIFFFFFTSPKWPSFFFSILYWLPPVSLLLQRARADCRDHVTIDVSHPFFLSLSAVCFLMSLIDHCEHWVDDTSIKKDIFSFLFYKLHSMLYFRLLHICVGVMRSSRVCSDMFLQAHRHTCENEEELSLWHGSKWEESTLLPWRCDDRLPAAVHN